MSAIPYLFSFLTGSIPLTDVDEQVKIRCSHVLSLISTRLSTQPIPLDQQRRELQEARLSIQQALDAKHTTEEHVCTLFSMCLLF